MILRNSDGLQEFLLIFLTLSSGGFSSWLFLLVLQSCLFQNYFRWLLIYGIPERRRLCGRWSVRSIRKYQQPRNKDEEEHGEDRQDFQDHTPKDPRHWPLLTTRYGC